MSRPRTWLTRTWDWTKSVAAALVLFYVLTALFVQAFHIPSGSMEGTLLSGDFLFANKALFGAEVPFLGARLPAFREPSRYDIVIFDSVDEPGVNVVKRVIGVPGDTIEMRENVVRINGAAVDEPYKVVHEGRDAVDPRMRWQERYLAEHQQRRGYHPTLQNWGPLVIPPDSFFVMGDNRDVSYDSRYWGLLGRDRIRGRPMLVYYSYDRTAAPFPLIMGVRWRRLMTRPK